MLRRPERLPTLPDRGCEVHPSCLSCPLPGCRYDLELGLADIRASERRKAIQKLWAKGRTVEQIAKALQVSTRLVYRYTEGLR